MDIARVFCKNAINKKLDAPIEEDLELDLPEGEEELDEAKKKKIKTTYTTGSIAANIDFFNKHNGTDDKAAQNAAADVNADMGQSGAIGGDGNGDAGSLSGGDGSGDSGASGEGASAGGAMGESLTEAKRYVKRYYIKPQNIFCSNKEEILKALIEHKDENLFVYTLVNLTEHEKDVTKLTNDDIIYYYDNGILYDKNHIRIFDYDLSIKHEEDRKKFTQEGDKLNMDKTEVKAEYEDRMTDADLSEELNEDIAGTPTSDVFFVMANSKHPDNIRVDCDNPDTEGIICSFIFKTANPDIPQIYQAREVVMGKVVDLTDESGSIVLRFANTANQGKTVDFEIAVDEPNAAAELEAYLTKNGYAALQTTEMADWFGYPVNNRTCENNVVPAAKICAEFLIKHFNSLDTIIMDPSEVTNFKVALDAAKTAANKAKNMSTKEWLINHIKTIEFSVPVCDNVAKFKARTKQNADKILTRWTKAEWWLDNTGIDPKYIRKRYTETGKWDEGHAFWSLACDITFDATIDTLIPLMPAEVKQLLVSTVKDQDKKTGETITVLDRKDNKISSFFLGAAIAEIFDYDLSVFGTVKHRAPAAQAPRYELDQDFVDVDTWGTPIEEDFDEEPCVICGEPIVGYGNNAEPYKEGRCCDACNMKFVIPARLQQYIDYRGMED